MTGAGEVSAAGGLSTGLGRRDGVAGPRTASRGSSRFELSVSGAFMSGVRGLHLRAGVLEPA